MIRKFCFALTLALLIVLGSKARTYAGGWAVITLEKLPSELYAGQAIDISFMVRQHGITPMDGLSPTVSVVNPNTGESSVSSAASTSEIGRYRATLTFPDPGDWEWSIQAFAMDQPMPTLKVLPATGSQSESSQGWLSIPLMVGLVGMAAVAVSLFLSVHHRFRWAPALLIIGVLVSITGFASAAGRSDPVSSQPASADSLESIGESLFIA